MALLASQRQSTLLCPHTPPVPPLHPWVKGYLSICILPEKSHLPGDMESICVPCCQVTPLISLPNNAQFSTTSTLTTPSYSHHPVETLLVRAPASISRSQQSVPNAAASLVFSLFSLFLHSILLHSLPCFPVTACILVRDSGACLQGNID